jgi:hypothetical protein
MAEVAGRESYNMMVVEMEMKMKMVVKVVRR